MTNSEKATQNGSSKKVKDKAEHLIAEMKQKGQALLNEGWESARQALDQKAKGVKLKAGELQDKTFEEISDDVKVYVRRSPLKSLGIAVAIGFLFGWLFKSDN